MSMVIDGTNGLTFNNATTQNSGCKVLQVVQGSTATAVSNSTSTYADTGLTATITPLFNTSKILVMVAQCGVRKSSADASNRVSLQLLRSATVLDVFAASYAFTTTAINFDGEVSINYLDSPATTSATTYKTQFQNPNNTASVSVQVGTETSTIILMEIAV